MTTHFKRKTDCIESDRFSNRKRNVLSLTIATWCVTINFCEQLAKTNVLILFDTDNHLNEIHVFRYEVSEMWQAKIVCNSTTKFRIKLKLSKSNVYFSFLDVISYFTFQTKKPKKSDHFNVLFEITCKIRYREQIEPSFKPNGASREYATRM